MAGEMYGWALKHETDFSLNAKPQIDDWMYEQKLYVSVTKG